MGMRSDEMGRQGKLELGRQLFNRTRTAAQDNSATGDHGGISVNVTEHGAEFHDITGGETVAVRVYEEAILITTTTDDE
jgi:hypothetical protein